MADVAPAGGGDNMDSSWSTVCCSFLKLYWKAVFSVVWPCISLIVFLLGFDKRIRCMYILMVMAGYWLTECIPLYVTGLMPLFMCPLLNVVPAAPICKQYMNSTNALFIVGLMIAISIENSGLHLRIALGCMLLMGCSPRKLHFGLTFITMFLSMWLINAAVCAMMCPIIMAVLKELEAQEVLTIYEPPDPNNPTEAPKPSKITMGYFFSAPISANIGGCATLVGTGTNLAYKGLYEGSYKNPDPIDFLPWMLYNVPPMLIIIFVSWLSLQVTCMGMFQPNSKEYQACKRGAEKKDVIRDVIKSRMKELGPWSFKEKFVLLCFVIIVVGWLVRSPQVFPGWGDLYGKDEIKGQPFIKDCTFPYVLIILMFMVPTTCSCFDYCTKDRSARPAKPAKAILTWDLFHRKFPWGMIFLIGGGFAIAHAGTKSGMSKYLGNGMSCFDVLPPFLVLSVCTAFGSIFTELTSNVAMCNLLTPILLDMSSAMKVHPALYTFPAALCCSHAFLMPTGTPTNAIALGNAGIPVIELIKHGAISKLAAWLVTIAMFPTYGRLFFDTSKTPAWSYDRVEAKASDH